MEIKPIGKVRRLSPDESALEIDPAFNSGLHGIRKGDRVQVLYWMHELKGQDRNLLQAHPRGDRSRPLKGVFGLRSPMRPNPIGVSTVEVRRVQGNRLFVRELDALDGSPVIDIKASTRRAE